MKFYRKWDLIFVSAVLLFIGLYVFWHLWKAIPGAYKYNLAIIKECLLTYLEQNFGVFPSSEEELLQKGFLKIENSSTYLLVCKSASVPEFRRCSRFRAFVIKYNTQYETLKLLNGQLVDQHTNQPVLLIDGPCRFLLPYKDYSIEIYEKMSAIKKKTGVHSPLSHLVSPQGHNGMDMKAFTGREMDWLDNGNLQILYYRARYYNPDTGRFLQRDPLGTDPTGGNVNTYSQK